MKSELGSNSNDDLIKIFINIVEENLNIPQINCGSVPDSRKNKRGANPVVEIMEQKLLSKIKGVIGVECTIVECFCIPVSEWGMMTSRQGFRFL